MYHRFLDFLRYFFNRIILTISATNVRFVLFSQLQEYLIYRSLKNAEDLCHQQHNPARRNRNFCSPQLSCYIRTYFFNLNICYFFISKIQQIPLAKSAYIHQPTIRLQLQYVLLPAFLYTQLKYCMLILSATKDVK